MEFGIGTGTEAETKTEIKTSNVPETLPEWFTNDWVGKKKALAEKARGTGATFLRAGVNRIERSPEGQWVLHTDAGLRQAENVIIAAGAWSAQLLTSLGYTLPLEAERGYHLILKNPGITVNNSIMDADAKFVASSMTSGIRCAGTAEFAGLNAPPDYRRARAFIRLAKNLFPDINTEDTVEWMGSRPSFPDSLPCLGEIPGHGGLFCAFGHSHYGFGMAPNTGRIMAGIITGEPLNIDLTPYRITRF